MRDTLKQRLFDLGYGTGSETPLEAITYIEELELGLYEMNDLYGSVKDGLEEKLAKAMEALRLISQMHGYTSRQLSDIARTVLAELEEIE